MVTYKLTTYHNNKSNISSKNQISEKILFLTKLHNHNFPITFSIISLFCVSCMPFIAYKHLLSLSSRNCFNSSNLFRFLAGGAVCVDFGSTTSSSSSSSSWLPLLLLLSYCVPRELLSTCGSSFKSSCISVSK